MHGPEVQAEVRALRERWFGLGSDAIDAVDHALTEKKDGRLGFQVLASIGVVPSPAERQWLTPPPPTDEEAEINKIAVALAKGSIERHRFFGMPLLGEDERIQRQVREANKETAKNEPLGTTKKDGEHTPE